MRFSFFREFLSRRYLRRLIAVATILVMIPCVIGFAAIYRISYQEVMHSNEEYYSQTLNDFSDLFSEYINKMVKFSWQISEDSRNPQMPAYALQRQTLLGNPINYRYPFISTLNQYRYSAPVENFGLYYPEYDILFFDSYKYDASSFMRDQGIDSLKNESSDFFDFLQNEKRDSVSFYAEPIDENRLFVGVQTTMGTTRDRALFLFILDSASFKISSILSESTYDAQFFLLDEAANRIVYTCGKSYFSAEEMKMLLSEERSNTYSADETTYSLYFSTGGKYGFSCAAVMPFDIITQNLVLFTRMATIVMVAAVALLIGLLSLLIYISYHPINRTLQLIGSDEPLTDEWQIIDDTLIQMRSEILEKNQLILDCLINNLLYGMEISNDDANRLGLTIRNDQFIVYTWYHQFMTTEQRAELVTALKNQNGVTAYITDILGHGHSVIICQIKAGQNTDSISAWLNRWFVEHYPLAVDFRAGIVVDSLNRIHDSYASCFPESNQESEEESAKPGTLLDPAENEHKRESQLQKMQKNVEDYIHNHFHDPTISQITVADHFGISVYSLSRLFSNHIGISFSKYITNLRLEEAKNMLMQTDKSIADISACVGMPNSSYFSRLFKQHYNASPIQYRNEVKKDS